MVDRAEAPDEASAREGDRLEDGTYEVVRARLLEQGRALSNKAQELNRRRLELFGGSELRMVASERVRTENNCVPRDIVAVGDQLLFGYNVSIGLRKETRVEDVLCLHGFTEDGAGDLHFTPVTGSAFLDDPDFRRDFHELFEYYKSASLTRLQCCDGRLLVALSTGDGVGDLKVFRFAVEREGGVSYIDNRGERDIEHPPSHDFEWTATSRDDHVDGRHPHVSILDEVFVETISGNLTIKIENNTEDGEGIYSEPVEDPNQSLEDAEIRFASVGAHILLCIRPYRESSARHLVFNRSTRRVHRIDAIAHACIQLPDDHGIIYPGGYTLSSGDSKHFAGDVEGMEFTRRIRSPNGEDVLFVFHEKRSGRYILLPYKRRCRARSTATGTRCSRTAGWSSSATGPASRPASTRCRSGRRPSPRKRLRHAGLPPGRISRRSETPSSSAASPTPSAWFELSSNRSPAGRPTRRRLPPRPG
jgi:hypothetical protein